MRRDLALALGLFGAPATLALAGVLIALPGERAPATAVYLLALGATLVLVALRAIGRARPARRGHFELAARHPRPERGRLRELDRIEHDVVQGVANPLDLHRRLRPLLREIAAHRLESGHGVDLDLRPGEARRLLGEETWEIVRPDRPVPNERTGGRLALAGLGAIVERLERL